jgi:uncharacterized repeat protein (TIGR02543 family)
LKKLILLIVVCITCFWQLQGQGNSTFGLTRQQLDALAIDPQTWTLQEFMAWDDWKPNPVINYEDPKDNPIPVKRTISGMIILVDFPDQPMISGMPTGSEIMGNPLISASDKSKLAQFWCDFLNTPGADNHHVTLNGYFLENSYGDWEIKLDACGPYTLSRFEFQYGLGYASSNDVAYQRFPEWFDRGRANTEAYDLAKADGIEFFTPNAAGTARDSIYDFVFVLHAGYDQSGAWQELGEMMFQNENRIHTVPVGQVRHPITGEYMPGVSGYDFSGEARIDRILAIVTAENFDLKQVWPNFYLFTDTATQNAEFAKAQQVNPALTWEAFEAKYPDMVQDILLTKLMAAKAEAHNHPTNPHYASAKTRYMPWSSWYGALGIWSGAGSATDSVPGFPSNRIPLSIQGESDGMGTFAHEFGHLMRLPDNYNNPYDIPRTRSYTGPYELMSRGSFGGPGGNHLRYQIPSKMGSSCPPNQVLRSKIGQGYTTEDHIVDVTYASIKERPVFARVIARNIPTDKGVLDMENLEIKGNRGIRITDMTDKTLKDNNTLNANMDTDDLAYDEAALRINPAKWNWGRNVNYTGYTIEVVDKTGYDSFVNDHGVMIAKTASSGPTTIFIQDAHPTPLDLIDFVSPDGENAMISDGDQLQLASALFHAGTHSNPTYFKESYPAKFVAGDNRTGLHGNVVNEYIDSFNELHFYVLDKIVDQGKYGDFLSYDIAVRSDAPDAVKVGGQLTLTAAGFEPASQGRYAVQRFTLKQSRDANGFDIIRIRLLGSLADEATVLNNVYAIAPGEEISFATYITATDGILDNVPMNKLIVMASSETDRRNEDTYGKAAITTRTITFLPNNGTGTMTPDNVFDGENHVIKLNAFSLANHTLTAWNTAADGSGTIYIPGETIPKVTSNITLHAQWSLNRYTINYNSNGGTGNISADAYIKHDSTYTLKTNTFTREGYLFAGWNTEADGSGIAYPPDGSFSATDNVTLYAQWTPQEKEDVIF